MPPEVLMDYFGFSPFFASFIALTELGAGLFLIIGGLIKGSTGNLITRVSALAIAVVMINAFALAHRDWFITTKLFTSEQIFLFIGGLVYLKVPQKVNSSITGEINKIKKDIDEAEKLKDQMQETILVRMETSGMNYNIVVLVS